MVHVDEAREEWINLMMCRDAAKTNPELRKIYEERSYSGVVRAANECDDYEDFKCRMEGYAAAAEGNQI